MLRRSVVTLLTVAAGLLITAGSTHAAPAQGYTGACVLGVVATSPHAGDAITVTGDNFPPGPNTLPIMIDNPTQQIGTAHVNAAGHFSDQATLPSDLSAGAHTISVSCATTGVDSTSAVNVLGASVTQSSSAPLPRTGNDTEPLVLAGLGAVAVGTALVLTARRRRAQRVAV